MITSWYTNQQQEPTSQGDDESFIGFKSRIGSASPFKPRYPAVSGVDLTSGWSTVVPQVPSLPRSAASPLLLQPCYQYQHPQMHNILTDIYSDTRVQIGQTTLRDNISLDIFAAPGQDEEPEDKTLAGSNHF